MLDGGDMWYTFRNGARLRVTWSLTDRQYRGELTLSDDRVLRRNAGAGLLARLIAWAEAEDAKVTAEPQTGGRL